LELLSTITADVIVDGVPTNILEGMNFYCRDGLIPNIWFKLKRLHDSGKELRAFNEDKSYPRLELETSNNKGIAWSDIMGINQDFSPIASPFLLRFYIGRVRNGYQYQKLEDALRKAGSEGVRLEEDMAVAWNLKAGNAANLGLGNILPTVSAWNYAGAGREVDYARVFPPSKFI
jgi:hypothetical protein